MKGKLVAILGIVLILVMAGACARGAEASKDVSVIVPVDEFAAAKNVAKTVEINPGEELVVILGSNPSTGYSWTETAQIGDGAVIAQTGHNYVAPGQTSEPVVGAAGHERWTFDPLAAGTTKITMKYSRPWETVPAEWNFELTVVVK